MEICLTFSWISTQLSLTLQGDRYINSHCKSKFGLSALNYSNTYIQTKNGNEFSVKQIYEEINKIWYSDINILENVKYIFQNIKNELYILNEKMVGRFALS